MRRVLTLAVTTCSLIALFAGPGQLPAAPGGAKSMLELSLQLPDGDAWVLGPKGLGRPFMARLLLSNAGDAPVTIWDPHNSEGATLPFVTLTDVAGKQTVFRPAPIARAAGFPTAWIFKPHEVRVIEIELLRLVDAKNVPAPGKYTIKAGYANENGEASGPVNGPIWTGAIESNPQVVTIAAP